MSRKVILLFIIALVLGGVAWAQSTSSTSPPTVGPPAGTPSAPEAGGGRFGFQGLGAINAVRSTEALNSADMFTSFTDDFVNPRFFDPEAGGLFLGLNGLTGTSSSGRVDVGFATTLGDLYLGVFYGGQFFDAHAVRRRPHNATDLPELRYRELNLQSEIAVLVGVMGMGFRLDAVLNSNFERSSIDYSDISVPAWEDLTEHRREGGPFLALTWGAEFGALAPWARVGYRFADMFQTENESSDGYGVRGRLTANSALELAAGARFTFEDGSAVGASLRFANVFPDRENYEGVFAPGSTPDSDFSNRRFGMTAFGVDAYYFQYFELGVMEFGFSPNLGFAYTHRSNDWDGGTITWAAPANRWVTIDGGVDLGVKVQPTERTTVFAGASLRIFDWTRWTESRARDDNANPALRSSWALSGLQVNNPAVGVTFAPAENAVLGLGVSDLINGEFSATFTVRF